MYCECRFGRLFCEELAAIYAEIGTSREDNSIGYSFVFPSRMLKLHELCQKEGSEHWTIEMRPKVNIMNMIGVGVG